MNPRPATEEKRPSASTPVGGKSAATATQVAEPQTTTRPALAQPQQTMRAIVCRRYGSPDVLRLEEIATPTLKANEVLVAVEAAALNAGDKHLMRGTPALIRLIYGLSKPKYPVPGMDIAGRVVATGEDVERFRPGDEVYGDLSRFGNGAFAEYVAVPEEGLAPMPAGLGYEAAAAIPTAAVTALQGLRDAGRIGHGQRVLITGASGGVGTFAVQIAKSYGTEVTAVCSARKAATVRSIGADHVIDYEREDFTRDGRQYDLILDAGAYRSVFETRRALRRGGRYVLVGGGTTPMFQAMVLGRSMLVKPNRDDLIRMKELVEAGDVAPVVDKAFPLEDAAAAMRYLEAGNVLGKVVLRTGS